MATTEYLIELMAADAQPVSANSATFDTVADASTPNMWVPVLDFSGATAEYADWIFQVPDRYAGTTGWTFSYKYATDGSDADLVDMEFRVLILADLDILTDDLGVDGQTAVSIQDTPPATPTNKLSYSTTGALAKANMGTPSAGDLVLVRAKRDVAAASNTDDLQLASVLIIET